MSLFALKMKKIECEKCTLIKHLIFSSTRLDSNTTLFAYVVYLKLIMLMRRFGIELDEMAKWIYNKV